MSSVHRVQTAGDTTGLVPDPMSDADCGPTHGQADLTAGSALVGQAMVERAKSVIVVAERVGEDEATQILLHAASDANIPVRMVADQVMTAVRTDADEGGMQNTSVRDTLVRALGVVRPMERPQA